MTPLAPAMQPPAPQAVPAPVRGASPRPAGTDSFAAALEQEHVPVDPLAAEPALEEETAPDAPEPAEGMPDHQIRLQAAPAWPPAGLAGLFLSAARGESADTRGPVAPGPITLATAAAVAGGEPAPPALAGAGAEGMGGADAKGDGGALSATFALPLPPSALPTREAAPMLAAPVPTPDVRSDDFSERFGAQLQWMASEKIGHARIRVSPQQLGPVEVLLRLDGERISADFISSHPETRQALEQGLPRLRDMLGEHGFQLAHAGVGDQSASSSGGGGGTPTGMELADDATGAQVTQDEAAPVAVSRGLLDAYA